MNRTLFLYLILILPIEISCLGAARSFRIKFSNQTQFKLVLLEKNLGHGIWSKIVPSEISPGQNVEWESESNGFATGTQGFAVFQIVGDTCTEIVESLFRVDWNNPFIGRNSNNANPPGGFGLSKSGGSGNNATLDLSLGISGAPIRFVKPVTLPLVKIHSLKLRIKTKDAAGAGTDDDIYFSIGPKSWGPLRGEFEANSLDVISLDVSGADLYASDIIFLGIEKKGEGGFHGTSDGGGIIGIPGLNNGAWRPEWLELTANGSMVFKGDITYEITSPEQPFWKQIVQHCKTLKFADYFANSLRLEHNDFHIKGREIACATTFQGKLKGISGWIPQGRCGDDESNLLITTIQGRVLQTPPLSGDGLVTIDIELVSVRICDVTYNIFDLDPIHRPRYVRLEFRPPAFPLCVCAPLPTCIVSVNYLDQLRDDLISNRIVPRMGAYISASGPTFWDTDEPGWFEIHPTKISFD